ncbi:MAG: KH domain-containing protein [Dehalococcoidia bacterium]
MKELVEYIARAIVDNPDQVRITEEPGEDDRIIIKLEVAQEDKGKVIGKQGQTAKAIRTLLRIAAVQRNVRASLEIV